jgi:F420-0:gamma-glutamyl ligase-like protein
LRLKVRKIKTGYWKPGTNAINEITSALSNGLDDGDIVVISEKALATAQGLVIDESEIEPGSMARLIAKYWERKVWGGPLGRITKLKQRTLENLRNYPIMEGAAHKQLALRKMGLLQALRHYSEGGIDASNLPYSLVSLPLPNPRETASLIRETLQEVNGRDVTVMIVDGDATFSWRNLHLAPRRVNFPGLIHAGGFLTFVIGRCLGLRSRPTSIAYAGELINPDRALWLAAAAHRARGSGAGGTVWGMSRRFGTKLNGVSLDMLEEVEHVPVVVLRFTDDPQKISSS